MKKLLFTTLALVLVLSLGAVVFATGANTGSITITNATIGETYYLYKFFDATYAVDEQGNTKYDANGKAIVAYTIKETDTFFDDLFGADGKTVNPYFIYDENTGVVTRRANILDADIISYLDGVANGNDIVPLRTIKAEASTVEFNNIPTGYYLVDRGISSIVTITSNVPDVNIIDKNQIPNVDDSFSKLVWDETLKDWVPNSSANIGDIIKWKIDFVATNYDGDDKVLYYSVRDTKSPSLWVEFNSITVKVGNTTLGKGYYWCAGDPSIDTDDWNAVKDSTKWAATSDEADWYLIHYTYDDFEIVIPWMDHYTFAGIKNTTKGYELTFDLSTDDGNNVLSESMNPSPVTVEIQYTASVGPDAANSTAQNSATLDWVTPEGTFGPEESETTGTKVYNLGITKTANDGTDTTAATRLGGAIFKLYKDNEYKNPIYVIPTNNEGVYILDDLNTDVSGENRVTARDCYDTWVKAAVDKEGKKIYVDANGNPLQSNMVVTPSHGQIVIMGLEAGTYYLEEVEAPNGYNKLGAPIEVTVGTGTSGIYSNNYHDLDGNEVTYSVYSTTIVNSQGQVLPSTGGEGTFWLITIGTALVICFAVFLITHKKMSIYTD